MFYLKNKLSNKKEKQNEFKNFRIRNYGKPKSYALSYKRRLHKTFRTNLHNKTLFVS